MKAYKLSLTLDCLCILIAAAVLYCANKMLLPMWALIAGAIVALALLIVAVKLLLKARKSFKQDAEEWVKNHQDAPAEEEREEN
ncbi:MAG: hypothetical protein KBT13_02980 [Bacteroidales bacterium]|uniref:hypothetical protein n=1 Tax=Sodaliphilus sp. TaxID=2815818 RepID=UPI001B49886B|nr:hypothetical protein [Candidatus Sodaliphilus limicaballi]